MSDVTESDVWPASVFGTDLPAPPPRQIRYAPDTSGTLLPSNSTSLERALDQLDAERLVGTLPNVVGTSGLYRQVPLLWDANATPMSFLPLLAWALRLDFFDSAWPERFQRDIVANARRINELRGTVAGLKLCLSLLGHPNARIKERIRGRVRGDGSTRGEGYYRGMAGEWAVFSVTLFNPISARQVQVLLEAIERTKRNCCHLYTFNHGSAPLLRGLGYRRGQGYTRGTV
jgi:phage tail P2-like protein